MEQVLLQDLTAILKQHLHCAEAATTLQCTPSCTALRASGAAKRFHCPQQDLRTLSSMSGAAKAKVMGADLLHRGVEDRNNSSPFGERVVCVCGSTFEVLQLPLESVGLYLMLPAAFSGRTDRYFIGVGKLWLFLSSFLWTQSHNSCRRRLTCNGKWVGGARRAGIQYSKGW